MQDKDLDKCFDSLLRQVNKRHYPYIQGDEILNWPKGRLEKLLEMGILTPSGRTAQSIRCPLCYEEFAEPSWREYPNGKKVLVWYCNYDPDELDYVEINPDLMRMWNVHVDKIPQKEQPEKQESVQDSIKPQTSVEPSEPASDSRSPINPLWEAAYQGYCLAQSQLHANISAEEAYNHLQKNGPEQYELPSFDTWRKYLSKARKYYGEQKRTLRTGRKGRSIAFQNEI